MKRFLIELRKVGQTVRAGIDFANNGEFAAWLKAYCAKKEWAFSMIDRSKEPLDVQKAECGSMPWKVAETVGQLAENSLRSATKTVRSVKS